MSIIFIIFISKLHDIGTRDPFLLWISSYISDRKQIIVCKIFKSIPIDVPSEVPQCSHLAPFYFYYLYKLLKHVLLEKAVICLWFEIVPSN